MCIVRKVQESMSDGCGRHGQLKEPKEWYRVYSLYGMCQELSEKGTVRLNE